MIEQQQSTFLFRKMVQIELCDMFGNPHPREIDHKDAIDPESKYKHNLCLVGEIKTKEELVSAVRSDPLAKFVLFRGQMADVSVNIPVFVDGRSVESGEWL